MRNQKVKSKILHSSSFLSNHQLLDLRNKSTNSQAAQQSQHFTRQPSSKVISPISLIPKKQYGMQKQNDSRMLNRVMRSQNSSCLDLLEAGTTVCHSKIDNAVFLLQDCLEELPEEMQKIRHKIRKSLDYIRGSKQDHQKEDLQQKIAHTEKNNHFLKKIETLYQHKEQIAKENIYLNTQIEKLHNKIKKLREKKEVCKINKEEGEMIVRESEGEKKVRESEGEKSNKEKLSLQQILINQSQLLQRKQQEHNEEANDYRMLIQLQALHIEEMLEYKGKISLRKGGDSKGEYRSVNVTHRQINNKSRV